MRIPAGDLEALVLDRLRRFFASSVEISAAISEFDLPAATQEAMLTRATDVASGWLGRTGQDHRHLITTVVGGVSVYDGHVELRLKTSEIAVELCPGDGKPFRRRFEGTSSGQRRLRIEAQLKRAGKGVRLIVGAGAPAKPDEGLVRLLAQAFNARDQLFSGQYDSVEDMAAQLGTSGTYVTSLVRLTYLNPDIVRAILDGRQPADLSMTRLMGALKDISHDWAAQRLYLGFADV
jgi:hypothetical protein